MWLPNIGVAVGPVDALLSQGCWAPADMARPTSWLAQAGWSIWLLTLGVQRRFLYNNQLSGSLPPQWSALTSLNGL